MFKWLKKRKVLEEFKNLELRDDIVDLTRENLNILPINWDLDDEPKQKEYLRDCKALNENNVLINLIETIIKKQVEYIAMDCPNEKSAYISRGSINGLSLLKEKLQEYSNLYDESNIYIKKPDVQKIFE